MTSSSSVNVLSDKTVVVVFSADKNVICGLLVGITSAMLNLNTQYRLKCYILCIGLSEIETTLIFESLQTLGNRLELEFINIDEQLLNSLYTYGRFSPAVYARYFLAELISTENYPIYIDTDIIIQCDLSLLSKEIDTPYYAAGVPQGYVHEYMLEELIKQYDLISDASYVNSGFMVINASKWRQEGVAEKLIAITRSSANKTKWLDQDIFNIMFNNKWQYIPDKWNTLVYLTPESPTLMPRDLVNIHTVAKYKPWMFKNRYSQGVVREFYRYLEAVRVPWDDCPGSTFSYSNPYHSRLKRVSQKVQNLFLRLSNK